jgi:predicted negative regulator of RcsB-dependent stress response
MALFKRYVVAFLVGVLGMGFGLGVWHLYEDHQNFHALLNWANAVAAAQAKAQTACRPSVETETISL